MGVSKEGGPPPKSRWEVAGSARDRSSSHQFGTEWIETEPIPAPAPSHYLSRCFRRLGFLALPAVFPDPPASSRSLPRRRAHTAASVAQAPKSWRTGPGTGRVHLLSYQLEVQ